MDSIIKVVSQAKAVSDDEMEIIFARTGVPDLDNDLFLPGAYKSNGRVYMSTWGHNTKEPPVAVGPIEEQRDGAMIYRPRWIGDSQTRKVLSETPDVAEFSYIFFPLEYERSKEREDEYGFSGYDFTDVQVYEVSPVNKGASIDTGIVGAKLAKSWGQRRSPEVAPTKNKSQEAYLRGLASLAGLEWEVL